MPYKVMGIDLRGTEQNPFGFVNLSNKKEYAGRLGFDASDKRLRVWHCADTPQNITRYDLDAVRAQLYIAFPNVGWPEEEGTPTT